VYVKLFEPDKKILDYCLESNFGKIIGLVVGAVSALQATIKLPKRSNEMISCPL